MSISNKLTERQVAAYSLSLALQRYAKWVSSLRSAAPCSLAAADEDVRLVLDLRDKHFRLLARQIDDLILGHQRLREALGAAASYTCCQNPREGGHVAGSAHQAEVICRLLTLVVKYLAAAPAATAGVRFRREANALPQPGLAHTTGTRSAT
jgi:hypothetical protein